MRKYFFLFCFSFLNIGGVYGQGGWTIGYLEIDSVSVNHLGLEVRMDFKSNKKDCDTTTSIRCWLFPFDIERLNIRESSFWFYEVRNIGPDYGYFEDQFLIEYNPKYDEMRLIRESWIESVKQDSVLLLANLELYDISGRLESNPTVFHKIKIVVSKSVLEGFIIRI